jgi:hypothetical protein
MEIKDNDAKRLSFVMNIDHIYFVGVLFEPVMLFPFFFTFRLLKVFL